MAHPYDENGFKHFLKFYDFDMDWYEIGEPIGFDGAQYVKKQLPNRWTRDVEYFAIDGLNFPDMLAGVLPEPRVFNPQGDITKYMDYGLSFLLENRRLKGSEMKVGYKIQRNGVDFREFELDNRDEDLTDGETYYKCKLVEIGLVADHFRNLKNTFNAFSDKNWKQETITPIESFNYLCKATPLNLRSVFKIPNNTYLEELAGVGQTYFNPSQVVSESQINDTLGWLLPKDTDLYSFGVIKAVVETNNINVQIDVDFDYNLKPGNPLNQPGSIRLFYGTDANPIGTILLAIGTISNPSPIIGTVNQTFNFSLDTLDVGDKLYIAYSIVGQAGILYRNNTITIDAVETNLDLVVPAVTYENLIKQGAKYVNDLPVVFHGFTDQMKNQAIFSRSLLEQRLELYTTNEDLHKSLQEYCADVEISKDNIDVRTHPYFYENVEIGSFAVIPSEDYVEPYADEYLINNFTYGFKNYEQDRTSKDTSKSFHTFAEFLPRNERSEKQKKIENEFIRDPLLKQSTFNLAIKSPNTSTEKDEKLFIEDRVELAPNTSREFVRTLLMRWVDGKLEILNRNTLGTNDDAVLNWNNIGLGIGASFEILSGANVGNYTIDSINTEGSVLVLNPVGSIAMADAGNYTVRMKHYYTNVQWQTRTTQGFSIAKEGFSNQFFTIKRDILNYWKYFLATATMYCKKDIVNSFFKNFGKLTTQLLTESEPIVEDATIVYADLPKPLYEPISPKSKIVAPYDDVKDYLERYRTVKGYIRCITPNGKVYHQFPDSFEYTLATSEADIQGPRQYEDEFLRIDISGQVVTVNDAPYDLSGVAEWFRTENDYIQLYDKKSQPLSNFYRYDFVILNGVKYNSIAELVTQLNTVVWT